MVYFGAFLSRWYDMSGFAFCRFTLETSVLAGGQSYKETRICHSRQVS